jgi:Domain of unknown function (DUF4288)
MGHVPTGTQWYTAELVMEITVAEALHNVVHKNLVLVRADTPEEAHRKAIGLGQKAETSYLNPKDRLVRIQFRGVSKLDVMYENLEDGAELTFEEQVGVTPEDIERLIPPKERLQVFIAPRPGREHDPDYRSKAVIKMAVDGVGSKDRGH